MNYFELFGIPVQLKINTGDSTDRFYELSRQYHPDYFATAGPSVQAEALEKSALLNKAYRTFRDPDATIKYVLQLKGLQKEEEKYDLPTPFLMEVLELNEELMDADVKEEEANDEIQRSIDRLQEEIYAPVKEIIENYREDNTSEQSLLQVKEYYYKKKYLDRIRRQLSGNL